METKWMEYKGKRILHVYYGGSSDENELINHFLSALDEAVKEPSQVLNIADFSNTIVTAKFLDILKKKGLEIMTKKFDKIALLGVTSIKKVFLASYLFFTNHKNMKTFESIEEAKEWLVE